MFTKDETLTMTFLNINAVFLSTYRTIINGSYLESYMPLDISVNIATCLTTTIM